MSPMIINLKMLQTINPKIHSYTSIMMVSLYSMIKLEGKLLILQLTDKDKAKGSAERNWRIPLYFNLKNKRTLNLILHINQLMYQITLCMLMPIIAFLMLLSFLLLSQGKIKDSKTQ
jgi:hypothetical protein